MRLHSIQDQTERMDTGIRTSTDMAAFVKVPGLHRAGSDVSHKPRALEQVQQQSNTQIACMPSFIGYHLRTLYLFTFSDFKTIVAPSTSFTVFTLLSGSTLTTSANVPAASGVFEKLPSSLLWTWLTLLVVDISNQWRPSSALEDAHNKPWRPVPSGRLSTEQARRLLLLTIPTVLTITAMFLPEGLPVTIIAVIGSYMYNDLGGADESFFMRNLMNAAAITCFAAGSALVALGPEASLNEAAYRWLGIIAGIVTTTMQVQDMEDQEGDKLRGRVTIPLQYGDMTARKSIALLVPIWSIICVLYWRSSLLGACLPLAIACTLAWKTLTDRTVESDKMNWRLWNVWMMALYILPIWNRIEDLGVGLITN